jgi:reactive intermediate/imine deaminase
MADIERLMVDGQAPPVSHYCHVVRAGNLVFVSGSVGIRADGSIPEDPAQQMEVALANVDACLRAAGAGREHVTKVTVFLTDIADRAKVNPPRQRYFGEHRPASTLVAVSALIMPALKVEIEAIAVIDELPGSEPRDLGQVVTF